MNPLFTKLLSLLAPRRQEYLAIDKNLNIVDISYGVQRFADCPEEAIKGGDVRAGFPELVGLEDILMAISEGQQDSFELKGIARIGENGSPLYLDLYIANNPDEKILKGDLIIFLEDVTEKMILEQSLVQASNEKSLLIDALAASKDYVDKIITSMADALLVTTASGTIKTVNRTAQDLFGYSEDELIGKPISTIITDAGFLEHNCLSQGKYSPLERPQVLCHAKTGKKVYVAFSCSAIQTDLEGLQDFAYVGRDVTEQKRNQQRLAAQYAVTRILSESATLRETPRKILQAICKNLEWELGELWTAGDYLGSPASEPTILRCVEMSVQPWIDLQAFTSVTWRTAFVPGVELPGQVWATRSPQWIADVVNDATFVRKEAAARADLHAAFGFPIQGDREILGVMTFFSREIQKCDDNLLKMMAAIGNQLGQFIKRKQAEAELQVNEEKLRLFVEYTPAAVAMLDRQMRYVVTSRQWLKDYALGDRSPIGHSHYEIFPNLPERWKQIHQRCLAGASEQCEEELYTRPDGTFEWERWQIYPWHNSAGEIGGIIIFTEFITERKLAQEALRESEERYRDLFENATDLIQSCDLNGQFIYVNRAWRETLGYSEAQVQQLNVFDILHADCKAYCLETLSRVMSGEKIDQLQAAFVSKDGKKISVEGNINCKFVEGKPVATRGIFRDITTRLEAEEALRQQQKQTERLLLNILPSPIAERLKQQPGTIADDFAEVSVMFADIVGFTQLAASLHPIELVELLNAIFSAFDHLTEQHGLEKIKTVGDAYMVVGGLPMRRADHAEAIAEMALDIHATIATVRQETRRDFNIRIGINTGPVVAGVIGIKKFSYDLWGDTVNIASRMESHGLAGQIQVTAATYERLREKYLFQERGTIQVKGKGEMTTYFLIGRKE